LAEAKQPLILYFWRVDDNPVQEAKLAGLHLYASVRGWKVEAVHESQDCPGRVKALLRDRNPLGCIVESAGGRNFLPPRLFGSVPVVYLDLPAGLRVSLSDRIVSVDDRAVAQSVFRELSSGLPAAYAYIEYHEAVPWSRRRSQAFRSLAEAANRPCRVFPFRRGENPKDRAGRLVNWLLHLPRPCGIFAANDETGADAVVACQAAGLRIPRDVSLVGVDDSAKYCEASNPPFTSLRLDFKRAGYVAAALLGRHFAAKNAKDKNAFLVPSASSTDGKSAATFGPLLVVRRESTGGRGRREPRILDALEMIRREACEGLTARSLAARFPGSRSLFNLRFREATGHSVLDEILHVRLEKALTLLADTDTAIGAIYAHCGFQSNRALDYLFHARFGMPMREWRRRNGCK